MIIKNNKFLFIFLLTYFIYVLHIMQFKIYFILIIFDPTSLFFFFYIKSEKSTCLTLLV